MSDFTVTNFYHCQDTKPTGIKNEYEILKYFLQKLEQKLTLTGKIYKRFFVKCFPTPPLSELTTEIF